MFQLNKPLCKFHCYSVINKLHILSNKVELAHKTDLAVYIEENITTFEVEKTN